MCCDCIGRFEHCKLFNKSSPFIFQVHDFLLFVRGIQSDKYCTFKWHESIFLKEKIFADRRSAFHFLIYELQFESYSEQKCDWKEHSTEQIDSIHQHDDCDYSRVMNVSE